MSDKVINQYRQLCRDLENFHLQFMLFTKGYRCLFKSKYYVDLTNIIYKFIQKKVKTKIAFSGRSDEMFEINNSVVNHN